jgi:hypothetical protein
MQLAQAWKQKGQEGQKRAKNLFAFFALLAFFAPILAFLSQGHLRWPELFRSA